MGNPDARRRVVDASSDATRFANRVTVAPVSDSMSTLTRLITPKTPLSLSATWARCSPLQEEVPIIQKRGEPSADKAVAHALTVEAD